MALLVYIHGKAYDLAGFRAAHPGGERWLEIVEGEDATALFESYHAMSKRRAWIEEKMAALEVHVELPLKIQKSSELYSFKQEGFYQSVAVRVRAQFPDGCRGIKAPWRTVAKNVGLIAFALCAMKLVSKLRVERARPCPRGRPGVAGGSAPWLGSSSGSRTR
jgi:hypothetical protein